MLELLAFAALLIWLVRFRARVEALERRLGLIEAGAQYVGTPARGGASAAEAAAPTPIDRRVFAEPVPDPAPGAIPEEAPLPADAPEHEPVSAVPDVPGPPASAPEPEPTRFRPQRGGFGFEELFGRRLPIWAGGVTLAVAGLLIVRYSIETGLLSPLVRFLSGLMFGTGLIAAAEAALRSEARLRDARVRQALAGAGIASLYASILVAANLYALIGPATAFAGMAAVTGLAMGLALRFGAPSALLGLVGGLAAPALVGAGEPNVPLLTLYLALAVGGLSVLSRVQRWTWLGLSALAGGLGWGAVLLIGGALDAASTMSIGLYVLLVGIALPLLALPSVRGKIVRIAGTIAAAAQVAALVATGGFALLNWGLFGLVSIAIVWIARREEGLERLPAVGLAIALLLLGSWPAPAPGSFALILSVMVGIYGMPALLTLWSPLGKVRDAAQIAALALGAALIAAMHYYRADHSADVALAAISLAAAALPAGAAFLGWANQGRREDARFALLASVAALLLALAAAFAAPTWMLPLLVGAIAVGLLLLSLSADDARIERSGWVFAAAAVPLLAAAPTIEAELARLFGEPGQVQAGLAFLRWALLSLVGGVFAWRARLIPARRAAQAAAVLFLYGAAAQLVSMPILPLLPAIALLALAASRRGPAPRTLLPAMAALLALTSLWAGLPLIQWCEAALASLAGQPLLVQELPPVRDALVRLFLPAAFILAAVRLTGPEIGAKARGAAIAIGVGLGGVGTHILFKQLFAIDSEAVFTSLGFAERTLWEALLVAAALAAWRLGAGRLAQGFSFAALGHFGAYSMILHNPLWAEQAVGAVPLMNLLVPSYGVALACLWAVQRFEPALSNRFGRPRTLLQMLLILFFAFSMLRQAAEGSILSGPALSAGEDIARSILAVLLAIGFLLWGMAKGSRDWRIGSLVLMLAAVAKVFLLDAAGLDGLMRIASFVALGLSLIGIGWLYSRSLGNQPPSSSS